MIKCVRASFSNIFIMLTVGYSFTNQTYTLNTHVNGKLCNYTVSHLVQIVYRNAADKSLFYLYGLNGIYNILHH